MTRIVKHVAERVAGHVVTRVAKRINYVLAAIAAVGLLVVGAQLRPTQAAWTEASTFAADASAGTWTSGPPDISDGGISAGNANTSIPDIVWNPSNPNQFCTLVTVTGTSATPQHWQLTVDLTRAPFNGVAWNQVSIQRGVGAQGPNNTLIVTGTSSPGNPFNPNWNNTPITNTQQATVQLCVYNGAPSQGDPSWYTVSVTQGTGSNWTNRRACLTVTATTTVTDLDLNPFFYAWQTTLDLGPAITRIQSAGGTADAVEWSPHPSSGYQFNTVPTTYNPVQPSYAITSGTTTALRGQGSGHETKTITACVRDY